MYDPKTDNGRDTGLCTSDLTVGYDSDIVKDIALEVRPGKIVTLIGPNGSGKSTILRTVTGLLDARAGVIMLDGCDKSGIPVKKSARRISTLMTGRAEAELMTCREVIESGRYPYTGLFGRMSEEDRKKVEEAVEATDTADIADRLFTNISDGQRQRVLLARAIAQDPGILVLDEPTSYLDIRYKTDILTRIRKLAKEDNIAVLLSLHEPEIAMKLSDTVAAVGDGKILRIGTPREVFTESFIRSLYKLGDADVGMMGTLWYDVDEDKLTDRDASAGWPEAGERRTHAIMIQGTMSGVGKSVITAALCRIFAADGYKTAPFKSQNMANNSYITGDGLEMGRAQALQAMCAYTSPDVRMNPILLKPTDDCGSQVVVMGKSVGNMRAGEYYEYKRSLVPVIRKAYDDLASEYDVIVIEGAGSPAEINLKENDIVNMGLAGMIDCPVILAGDIDRGGVFAQLIGTLDLLEPEERSRVGGLVINKFRGDEELLRPGIGALEARSGSKVIGVIPYIDINLDEEDSLSDRLRLTGRRSFDIAVVRLPHIANYTDLDVFDASPDVSVRYISRPGQAEGADIVILPGTKNTIGDLKWLWETKMADAVINLAKSSVPVLGICGGFQMLGRNVSDPESVEGGEAAEGLGLLPVDTVLLPQKTTRQFEGTIVNATGALSPLSGRMIKGYEIHMGSTKPYENVNEFTSDATGYCLGNIYGTYVHGLFDEGGTAAAAVNAILRFAGRETDIPKLCDRDEYRQKQADILADTVRASLDMDAIYRMMGLEKVN